MEEGHKLINNCIHKTIRVPNLVIKMMDTPQFHRLHRIKQLGTTFYVYPDATHNRFQHSLGVAHLAEKFAKHLQTKYPDLVDDKDVLCVMIAGLCHDLGHGPYSHLWEEFMAEASGRQYHHEDTSLKMLDRLLEDNDLKGYLLQHADIDERDIVFIKELISGPLDPVTNLPVKSHHDESDDGKWPYAGRGEEKSFLYEIVANKKTGIDVDKWDYFMRDDYYLGIGHIFDYQRFIEFCRVDFRGEPSRRTIILNRKEAQTVTEMSDDRTRLHIQGYQHRIGMIAERMLIDAWLLADPYVRIRGSNGKKYKLSEASFEDMEAHEKLTDEFVRVKIMEDENPEMEKAQEILRRMERRDFYVDIAHIDILSEDGLKGLDDKQILRDIQEFIDPSSSNMTADDLTIIRILVKSGVDMEKVQFYDNCKHGRTTSEAPSAAKRSDSGKEVKVKAKGKSVLVNTVLVLCKRKEVKDEAVKAVENWKRSRNIEWPKEENLADVIVTL